MIFHIVVFMHATTIKDITQRNQLHTVSIFKESKLLTKLPLVKQTAAISMCISTQQYFHHSVFLYYTVFVLIILYIRHIQFVHV